LKVKPAAFVGKISRTYTAVNGEWLAYHAATATFRLSIPQIKVVGFL
jgi:hypothetical protein